MTFYYANSPSPSLSNINLTVTKGASIGVLGGTGSGKSTLVSLIPRLYDVTEGEVRVFGVNVKEYSGAQIGSIISMAPQKAVLFSGTVRDNMLWGKADATDEEIQNALTVSQSA